MSDLLRPVWNLRDKKQLTKFCHATKWEMRGTIKSPFRFKELKVSLCNKGYTSACLQKTLVKEVFVHLGVNQTECVICCWTCIFWIVFSWHGAFVRCLCALGDLCFCRLLRHAFLAECFEPLKLKNPRLWAERRLTSYAFFLLSNQMKGKAETAMMTEKLVLAEAG